MVPKNNCHVVRVNLKTEHNVEYTVAVGIGTDRISGNCSATNKHTSEFFYSLKTKVEQDPTLSIRKMANQQNEN